MTHLDSLYADKESRGVVVRTLIWLLARPVKLLLYMLQGLSTHATMVRSAALTYYTLVSIVPVVALVFAVVIYHPDSLGNSAGFKEFDQGDRIE